MENLGKIGVIITLIFSIPFILWFMNWSLDISTTSHNPDQVINKTAEGVEKVAEYSIPWWISIIDWITKNIPACATIIIIAFLFFLKLIGEIK